MLLVFVPHDIPGAVLSQSSPQHIYLRPVRLWCRYLGGLWSYFGANATLLRRSSANGKGKKWCPKIHQIASLGPCETFFFYLPAQSTIIIQSDILVHVWESAIYYVLYLRRLRSHNVVTFPCFVRHAPKHAFFHTADTESDKCTIKWKSFEHHCMRHHGIATPPFCARKDNA